MCKTFRPVVLKVFSIGAHLKKKFDFASYLNLCCYKGDYIAVIIIYHII